MEETDGGGRLPRLLYLFQHDEVDEFAQLDSRISLINLLMYLHNVMIFFNLFSFYGLVQNQMCCWSSCSTIRVVAGCQHWELGTRPPPHNPMDASKITSSNNYFFFLKLSTGEGILYALNNAAKS